MIFDNTLSETISLSKIFDALLIQKEDPNIVIDFLKMHEENYVEIMDESFCLAQVFQLPFFRKLKASNVKWYFEHLFTVKQFSGHIAYLCWQALKTTNTGYEPEFRKWITHNVVLNTAPCVSHPYKCGHEQYIKNFECVCINALEQHVDAELDSVIAGYINTIDNTDPILTTFGFSLFLGSLLQYSTFSMLSRQRQYIFLTQTLPHLSYDLLSAERNGYILTYTGDCLLRFIKQLIEFEENPHIIQHIISLLNKTYNFRNILTYLCEKTNPHLFQLIGESGSVDEFMLNMSLQGISISSNDVLYLYMYNKTLIREWAEIDPVELDQIIRFSDFCLDKMKCN